MAFSRTTRGIIGTAVTWGAALSALGTVTILGSLAFGMVPTSVFGVPQVIMVAIRGFVVGAVVGGMFAGLMRTRERQQTLSTLSLKRVGLWGALAAAVVPAVVIAAFAPPGIISMGIIAPAVGIYGLLGAGMAIASVRMARKAQLGSGNDAELESGDMRRIE